jgi:hypothetical protein
MDADPTMQLLEYGAALSVCHDRRGQADRNEAASGK